MITHIRIDGFKSFLDFELDVPPLLALVGPNSSGKSNFFDALDFVKSSGLINGEPLRGRYRDQFHHVSKGLEIADLSVGVKALTWTPLGLLPFDYAATATGERGLAPDSELVLSSFDSAGLGQFGDLKSPLQVAADMFKLHKRHPDSPLFAIFFPYELRTWRLYKPDPDRMRGLGDGVDSGPLTSDGSNLAAVLGRIRRTGVFEDLLNDFIALTPDVVDLVPYLDERRHEWAFDVVIDGQGDVSSTLLSDGTLRILGLLAAIHDPDHAGTLLIEEVENGLHPSRLAELLRRIERKITDMDDPATLNEPLRQVIMTTHSPVVVSELYRLRRESLIFLNTAVRVDPESDRVSRVTVAKPVRDEGEPGTFVSPRQVRAFLSTVGTV
uniref:AAA family ATPase n=1 Tax=Herbidospora sakaeratensis TaxID=564415 RepID=UPI0007819878|nr:ATP-binding protein [Herbidospora sakaeratensis]